MKKIYFMGLTAAFAMSVHAQTTIKLKNPSIRGEFKNALTGKVASPAQVAGSIACNTQYVAGTTMNLQFSIELTNTDSEFGDMVTLTFPTGITPNATGHSAAIGTETLNPVSGQVISWGDNDNTYGGVVPGSVINFTVNVTIGAGVTGNQNATYNVSGDQYSGIAPAGDLIGGTCIIYPAGAVVVNMRTKFVQPTGITSINNCAMTTATVIARIINLGSIAESNVPVNYSINGVAATSLTIPGPIAPGDSVTFGFPATYNFSASDVYDMKAWTEVVGDVSLSNDTARLTITNTSPTPLTASTYSNGCESVYEYASVVKTWVGTGLAFTFDAADFHSGALSYNFNIPLTMGAPAGTYTAVNIFPCVDVTLGDTYRISYWRKTDTGSDGMSAITTGTVQSTAGTPTVLKAYSTIAPGAWIKDSVDYIATATETRYFSIRGKGTLSAITGVNVRIDDVMMSKVAFPTGIKTISSTEAMSIFPNPTSGILNVTAIEVTSSIEVFNVIGEKVYSSSLVKGNNVIDLSGLSNGAYFVKMNSNNQVITKKVVLSK